MPDRHPRDVAKSVASVVLRHQHRFGSAGQHLVDRVRWSGVSRELPADPWINDRGAGRRLLVGPANFAGQAWAWARCFERHVPDSYAQSWTYVENPAFGFSSDYSHPVGTNRASASWQRRRFERVVQHFDAVIIEAGRPLFGRLFRFDPLIESRELARAGLRVAMLWHGSDIRVPTSHANRHPRSPYADANMSARVRVQESVALRNQARLAKFDGPVLVSTPDLLADVPGATWCPVVVDRGIWRADKTKPAFERGRPIVVAHVPSNPWLKGSNLIQPILERLQGEGLVEYRAAVGLDTAGVRELYLDSDVVLDQFRLGIYGVAACEAMSAGRLVISQVDPFVRQIVRDQTDLDLPIEDARIDTLESTLRKVASDRIGFREKAASGEGFVSRVHDGRRSARVILGSLFE